MPHKYNAPKRHHIARAKYTIANWSQYEAGLKQRVNLTLWVTPEEGRCMSDLAIQTCLMLRTSVVLASDCRRSTVKNRDAVGANSIWLLMLITSVYWGKTLTDQHSDDRKRGRRP
ncbi:MAG: hypothetical protein RLY17_1742 [Pseudomonadota bacterium]|jgi:hypothetical protein